MLDRLGDQGCEATTAWQVTAYDSPSRRMLEWALLLPLLSMSPGQVERILAGAFERFAGDACFYEFTYGPRCPVPLAVLCRLGLTAEFRRFVPLNLPPASVYRIARLPFLLDQEVL